MTVRVVIACVVISLLFSIFFTIKKKKGYFIRKRTVNVTPNSQQQPRPRGHFPHQRGRAQMGHGGNQQEPGYVAPQQPGYPQNGTYPHISTNLLSYTPSAPPYTPNVYPPPPEYTADPDDDPVYPRQFGLECYPGAGFTSPMSPPPPYELINDKNIANGAPPGGHSPRHDNTHKDDEVAESIADIRNNMAPEEETDRRNGDAGVHNDRHTSQSHELERY